MKIRESGRSTDFITPSFGHGCLYNCTYCYMKRHKPDGLSIATNPSTILTAVHKHYKSLGEKQPNQTHSDFWTYDISCNEDFALHLKHHEWKLIFDYFTCYDAPFASFATKYVNRELLNYSPKDPEGNTKIRIRMSLMPEEFRKELEPNTSTIIERILFIDELVEAGYEVHVNFSPVIVVPGALNLYRKLFNDLHLNTSRESKKQIQSEVIFLTHNEKKHEENLKNNLPGEDLIWKPKIQRTKFSTYGGKNLRYEPQLKRRLIDEWKKVHKEFMPWNPIRYIF